jgi:prepilin-type N-terminal cleavage/methylation domain-containing protein
MKATVNPKVRASAAGFTLVELMVVVAIIGILAAVAGPRVQAFRAKGVQSEAKANLHSIYLAQLAYEDANDQFAPSATCPVAGGVCGALTHQSRADNKYAYGWLADPNRFLAGASSRRPLLRGRQDQWAVNTNKALCSIDDVTAENQGTVTSRCVSVRTEAVAVNAATGQPTTPLSAVDNKQ